MDARPRAPSDATAQVHGLILATRNVRQVEALDIEWLDPFTLAR